MNYIIREMTTSEYPLLEEFLYQAIFIPDGCDAPSREILQSPELQIYIENFKSKQDDQCFVADVNGQIVGAVWVRMMKDYGHVDDETPSFAISICKEYRGMKIGTNLMKKMLDWLKSEGYKKASLAVQKKNYAYQLYKNLGFFIIDENKEEFIMVINLTTYMSSSP